MLVVDDRADTRDFYDRVLGAAGYSVVSAESVEQARAIAGAIAFDLVVIDVDRPGMHGFELAQRLHAQGRRRPRLLAVTGHPPEDTSTETVLFDAYLITPCPPEKLIAVVTDLLAKRG
ncbi:MAG TPA: response regulator [Candidatus Acidoferrum sp.]|nr:response regulator [Candidatus Acidoferrum sp.]